MKCYTILLEKPKFIESGKFYSPRWYLWKLGVILAGNLFKVTHKLVDLMVNVVWDVEFADWST